MIWDEFMSEIFSLLQNILKRWTYGFKIVVHPPKIHLKIKTTYVPFKAIVILSNKNPVLFVQNGKV